MIPKLGPVVCDMGPLVLPFRPSMCVPRCVFSTGGALPVPRRVAGPPLWHHDKRNVAPLIILSTAPLCNGRREEPARCPASIGKQGERPRGKGPTPHATNRPCS